MSQVSVKWCCSADLQDKPEAIADYGDEPVPVVPLSALREVVEGLKMIADGTHNQLSEWLIARRENVIDVGEANKSSAKSLVAQRLLASLDAEGVQ